jgi:hypothetical protein
VYEMLQQVRGEEIKYKPSTYIIHYLASSLNTLSEDLITFCVESAFYNKLLKKDKGGDRSDRKTRNKTLEATG